MSKSVFVVQSGRFDEMTGNTNWLNLFAFGDYESAQTWIDSEIAKDPSFNEDLDYYEINEVTVYE